jgi:hypothetical protein
MRFESQHLPKHGNATNFFQNRESLSLKQFFCVFALGFSLTILNRSGLSSKNQFLLNLLGDTTEPGEFAALAHLIFLHELQAFVTISFTIFAALIVSGSDHFFSFYPHQFIRELFKGWT